MEKGNQKIMENKALEIVEVCIDFERGLVVLGLFSAPELGMEVGRILMEWSLSLEIHKGSTDPCENSSLSHPCCSWIEHFPYISFRAPSISHVWSRSTNRLILPERLVRDDGVLMSFHFGSI